MSTLLIEVKIMNYSFSGLNNLGDSCFQDIWDIYLLMNLRNFIFTVTYEWSPKTRFSAIYSRIYLPKQTICIYLCYK